MELADSLANLLTGLGTSKDKATHSFFGFNQLSKAELDAMYYCEWLPGEVIDAPVDDMTREWRSWNAGPRQLGAIHDAEAALGVREKVNRALKMARLYGGSAILIGDGAPDPAEPMNVERIPVGGIKYLHTFSRWELVAAELDRDPASPTFGEPIYYQLGTGIGTAPRVHPSRVVRFVGLPRLEMAWSLDGWGQSILQRIYEAMRNAIASSSALSAMLPEAKLDVIKIKGLTQNVGNAEYRARVLARFGLANNAKSISNALLLDADEDWNQKTLSLGGFPDIVRLFLEIAAGAADIPVTRLLGTSAKGLNATGEGDLRNYYDGLAAKQEVDLRPALTRLDEALIRHSIGRKPKGIRYTWNPLWQMRENEKSAIGLQFAQADQIYATMGVMPPSALRAAVRNRLLATDTYPGLKEALDAADQTGEASAPLIVKAEVTSNEINMPSAGAKVPKT
jgi:phage-related protein (TIGR01555 family)